MIPAKPFLKWAGGKKHLVTTLCDIASRPYNTYFEPFLGSGTLFFALAPKQSVLSDLNSELIETYIQLKLRVEDVVKYLKRMSRSKKLYYRIRSSHPSDAAKRAARLIYLNRNCWNGLYRVNSKGIFNVPYGRYKNPTICDKANLSATAVALSRADLLVSDFEQALEPAGKRDLVYLDPPYRTTAPRNGFLKYNSSIFSWDDQIRLARVFRKLDRRGAYAILTNANHPDIRALYCGFNARRIRRPSLIAGDVSKRGSISELIVTNF